MCLSASFLPWEDASGMELVGRFQSIKLNICNYTVWKHLSEQMRQLRDRMNHWHEPKADHRKDSSGHLGRFCFELVELEVDWYQSWPQPGNFRLLIIMPRQLLPHITRLVIKQRFSEHRVAWRALINTVIVSLCMNAKSRKTPAECKQFVGVQFQSNPTINTRHQIITLVTDW